MATKHDRSHVLRQTLKTRQKNMATKHDRSRVLRQTRPREQFQSPTLTQGQNEQHVRHDPVTKLKIRPTNELLPQITHLFV